MSNSMQIKFSFNSDFILEKGFCWGCDFKKTIFKKATCKLFTKLPILKQHALSRSKFLMPKLDQKNRVILDLNIHCTELKLKISTN